MLFALLSFGTFAQSADPTRPFTYQGNKAGENSPEKLVLESIIHGDQIHTVIISGKQMQVGDSIGEHRLVAVNDDSVVLRTATERLKLYVFSGVIVKKQ